MSALHAACGRASRAQTLAVQCFASATRVSRGGSGRSAGVSPQLCRMPRAGLCALSPSLPPSAATVPPNPRLQLRGLATAAPTPPAAPASSPFFDRFSEALDAQPAVARALLLAGIKGGAAPVASLVEARRKLIVEMARHGEFGEAAELLLLTRRFGLGADPAVFGLVVSGLVQVGEPAVAADLWAEVAVPAAPAEGAEQAEPDHPGLWAEPALQQDPTVLRAFINTVAWAATTAVPAPEGTDRTVEQALAAVPLLRAALAGKGGLSAYDARSEVLLHAITDPAAALDLVQRAATEYKTVPDPAIAEHGPLSPDVWRAVVNALCGRGEFALATKAADEAGPTEEAALAACNALIAGLSLAGRHDEAMRVASSMRRDRFLLPDGVTVASLLLGLRDPPAPQDAMDAPPPPPSEADVLRARRVLDVFSSLVFDPTFAPAMGQPADDPPLFSDQAAPPAPADAGRDMPIDLSDFPFAAHLLLRSAAVATRSGAAVAECHRRIVSLDLVPGEDPRRLSGTLVSALVMAGSPARAGGHLRRAWEGGEAPEAGRVATVWLALDGAGRREEAGRWLEFARGMGGEVGGEVEVLEAYFKKREAGEGVAG